MRNGWVQVRVPDALITRAARWRVRVGTVSSRPGEKIPVAAGEVVVTVGAELALPSLWAYGILTLLLRVEPGGLTCIDVSRTVELAHPLLTLDLTSAMRGE
jgi:hypothetical protein